MRRVSAGNDVHTWQTGWVPVGQSCAHDRPVQESIRRQFRSRAAEKTCTTDTIILVGSIPMTPGGLGMSSSGDAAKATNRVELSATSSQWKSGGKASPDGGIGEGRASRGQGDISSRAIRGETMVESRQPVWSWGCPAASSSLELEVTSGPASVDQLLPLARSLTEQSLT